MQDLYISIAAGLSPKERLEAFTAATFFTQPKLFVKGSIKTSAEVMRLHDSAAEALFYFHTNQFEKISLQHQEHVRELFKAAKHRLKFLIRKPTLMWSTELQTAAATTPSLKLLAENLPTLIAAARQETFAATFASQALANCLELINPFTGIACRCQESYELVNGINCLRFSAAHCSFFLLQELSCMDSIFFPEQNLMIAISSATNLRYAEMLTAKLLGEFDDILDYAQTDNQFWGVLASHGRPAHFFYEILPTLMAIYKTAPLSGTPANIIMRRNQDFVDLVDLFPEAKQLVLGSEDINALTLKQNRWLMCVGTIRDCRLNRYPFYQSDHYLLKQVLDGKNDEAETKHSAVANCYPLVWIGLEGQKRCWLEQVEGYAYILNNLAKRYPNLGVIIDGWTLPFTPSEKSLVNVSQDLAVADKLLRKLKPSIKHVLTIGGTSRLKIHLGQHVDFFICNFATGSMFISRMLGKPGFCHASNALSAIALGNYSQIQSNRRVYLLPQNLVKDRPNIYPFAWTLEDRKKPIKLLYKSIKLCKNKILGNPENPPKFGSVSYSVDKIKFYRFINERLDDVLSVQPDNTPLQFFIEAPFTVSPQFRGLIKKAVHGNFLPVFPGQPHTRQVAELANYPVAYLRRNLIYGEFSFGAHVFWSENAEYLIWLSEPLQRLKWHVAQFAKNQVVQNQPQSNIADLLTKGFKGMDNYYTRILSGQDVPFGHCTENMLVAALDNLARYFVFIGIHEQTAESFDRLCAFMDWDRALFPDHLGDQSQVPDIRFNSSDTTLAEGLVRLDLRLYHSALEMVKEYTTARFAP